MDVLERLKAHLQELERSAQFEAQAINAAQQNMAAQQQAINNAEQRLLRLQGGITSTRLLIQQIAEGKEAQQDELRLRGSEESERECCTQDTCNHAADDTASG